MAGKIYVGGAIDSPIAHEMKSAYLGVGGIAKKIKKIYFGVNGIAKEVYSPLKIVSWADGTDEEIAAMVNAHYAGEINLYDYWNIGDERVVSLSAMEATGVGESHVAQTVTMVLMNKGGFELTSGKQCAFVVGQKNGLANGTSGEFGYMNSSAINSGGWNNCARRTWCNNVYKNAIPSSLVGIFKEFKTITADGGYSSASTISNDYFALPAEKEVFGSNTYANSTAESTLTQFEYYKTSANRIKKRGDNGLAYPWWERSPYGSGSDSFCYVKSDGSANAFNAGGACLVAPFGCI